MEIEGFTSVSAMLRSGVYALVYRRQIVYIGQSKQMLTRIYSHRQVWQSERRGKSLSWIPVKGILFDEVYIRPCHPDQLNDLERELIQRHQPKYNKLLKGQPKPPPLDSLRIKIGSRVVTIDSAMQPAVEPSLRRRLCV